MTSDLLEIIPENGFLNKKNIKNFEGSDNFRPKAAYSSHHQTFLPIDKGIHSSDEDDNEQKPLANPFERKMEGVLFRKCMLKNLSSENLLLTFRVVEEGDSNALVPQSPISLDIRSDSSTTISLYKKDISKDFGNLKYEIRILGKATREGYWPRQIITPVPEEEKGAAPDPRRGSDD